MIIFRNCRYVIHLGIFMHVVWIILVVLLCLIIGILFTPIIIHIHSEKEIYFFQITGIIRIRVLLAENSFKLRITLFFIPFTIDPTRWTAKFLGKISTKKSPKKKKERFSLRKVRILIQFITRIIKSFKLKHLRINFDTDDFVVNAQLVPVLTCINNQNRNIFVSVNFIGENLIILTLKNRLFNIAWLSFKYLVIRMRKAKK